jgi:16S rRNA (guanine966-N2)-methyltransferase
MREEEDQMNRIIAGSVGGRRISMPPGAGTRPTTDRVREAIFSAVAAWAGSSAAAPEDALAGLAFCDLYAGSGAVGLEAASRGAAPVLLLEHDRRTASHIRRSAAELDLSVTIQVGDVPSLLGRAAPACYDIVFADPPYDQPTEMVDAQLTALINHGWVCRPGLVILERSRRSVPPNWPGLVSKTWNRAYGETGVYFGSLDGKGEV